MTNLTSRDLKTLTSKFAFAKIGDIKLIDENIRFSLAESDPPGCGYVYLWVESSNAQYSIVYVGKAGKTMRKRCTQHEAGFKRSVTGKAHAERLRKGLRGSKSYALYARKSENGTVLGVDNICMASVEELACIRKFEPAWNRSYPDRANS